MKRWTLLQRNFIQGAGSGLMAGSAVGLFDVALLTLTDLLLLMDIDQVWLPLTGLLYAVIVYGIVGLLSGLSLGLLRGLWNAWRDRGGNPLEYSVWAVYATLIASPGTLLVVYNRVRHDVLGIPLRQLPSLSDLFVFLALAIALIVGLWFLLRPLTRHSRLVQPSWNVGLYLVLLLVVTLVNGIFGSITVITNRGPAATSIPPDLRDRPNIIFIIADTLRADRLGSYGHSGQLTPHIDALAQDGVLYRQMSVQASWTRPSIATMLTSLYPSSHRAVDLPNQLPDEVVTLPEALREQGYRTVGFTTNIHTTPRFNFHQGYDEYTYLEPTYPFLGSSVSSRFAVSAGLRLLRSFFQSPARYPPDETYQNAATLNQQALSWLEANRGTRFFLFLHYMDPHHPYVAHPYDGTSVVRVERIPVHVSLLCQRYDGEVKYLDSHLGVLFDALKRWDLYDDSLIVFTADHGEEFYEHGGWDHGRTLYEEQLRVPLIIKYPDGAHAGTVDTDFARGLDIAPTVLDVVGFSIPESMQGVSLQPGALVTRAGFLFAEVGKENTLWAIRTRRYKLIVANEGNSRGLPTEALFDLQTDSTEQYNLASDKPDIARSLREAMRQVIYFAIDHAVVDQSKELDAATRERLRSLGY